MKSILVMGGSYFLGKEIVMALVKKGHGVTVLNRGSTPLDMPEIAELHCDRNDPIRMQEALKGKFFDTVIDVSVMTPMQSKILTNALNIKHIQQFITISSATIYFPLPSVAHDDIEDGDIHYVWGEYAANKAAIENHLLSVFQGTETNLCLLRPVYLYGPGNYTQREGYILSRLERNLPIVVPQNNPDLQFIHVRDLANLVGNLTELEKIPQVLNVGNKHTISCAEWVQICADAVNVEATILPFNWEMSEFDCRDFFPYRDLTIDIETNLMWDISGPETDLLTGFKETYKVFKELEDNEEPSESYLIMDNNNEMIISHYFL